MKTPREILLARHSAAAPKLDAIRHEMVKELNRQDTGAQSWAVRFASLCLGCSNKIWLELVWPCRRIWTGLAAVWLLILAVNFAQHDATPAGKITTAPVMMSFREQQRWMNELFADRAPAAEAEPPKMFVPKPRSENFQPANV